MSTPIRFDQIRLAPEIQALRAEVRAFLHEEIAAGTFDPLVSDRESGYNPGFSRRLGERGWIGMTWPKRYGGRERSFLERYVVTEECRVANAPVVQTFVPLTRKPPFVGVAFVRAAKRSEPEPGSLIPIQKQHSPRVIRGRMSDLIRSFAYLSRIGPLCRSAVKCSPTGAFATRHSSVTT